MENASYLGIDWGAADVGLAFADGETKVPLALLTLKNDERLLERIVSIVREKGVGTIVIGVATHVNRKEVRYPGEILGEALQGLLPDIRIAYEDEMFTTKIAQANLIAKGAKGVSHRDDEEAARIILAEWLNK